jgi:hypothetical protein
MPNIVVRDANREDLEKFFEQPQKFTMKAIVGEIDGKIVAVGGVVLKKGRWLGFADITDDAKKYKMRIMRHTKLFIERLRKDGVKYIYVKADPDEPKAIAWITSLGFELDPRSQHLYRWKSSP